MPEVMTAPPEVVALPPTPAEADPAAISQPAVPNEVEDSSPIQEAEIAPALDTQTDTTAETNNEIKSATENETTEKEKVQKKEIQQVTNSILQREIINGNAELSTMTEAQLTQIFTENPSKSALQVLHILKDAPTRFNGAFDIATENGTMHVTNITSIDGETYTCVAEGQSEPIDISRQTIIDTHMITESDAILSAFSEGSPERAIIEMQINLLKDPDSLSKKSEQEVDDVITTAAEANGIPTTNDLAELGEKIVNDSRNKVLSHEEQKAQNALLTAIEKAKENGNILTAKTISDVLTETGGIRDLEARTIEIEKAKKELEQNPNEESAKKLVEYAIETKILEKLSAAISDGGELSQFIEGLSNGTADLEKGKEFKEALRNNNFEEMFKSITNTEGLSPEEIAAIEKIKKLGKNPLFKLILMLALFATTAIIIDATGDIGK